MEIRIQVNVTGVVQGVGFRPFVYKLAQEEGLNGWVRNNSGGVQIEVEGPKKNLNNFLKSITIKKPPLAYIEDLSVGEIHALGEKGFTIVETVVNGSRQTLISPDVSVCDECLKELFDPNDRRFRYPFINCTNCGPRFTIINDVPYDRVNTTMADFPMCNECTDEYTNPIDRRFHAEPNACQECGPEVYLLDSKGCAVEGDPIAETISLLKDGAILAIKGLGGFHLACDAANEGAVKRLREQKNREDKPFAIMCRDLTAVAKFCFINDKEKELLENKKRPIVLLKKKPARGLIASGVAPGNDSYGVMLPYTPLHYLIMEKMPPALVMTSGNHTSEPIIYKNQEAQEKLWDVADYFLLHNREIYQRCDDSVIRVFRGRPMILRRSRGYAPEPIKLPFEVKEILACGGELKNTFCLTKDDKAYLSHHIGDLKNPVSLEAFEEGIEHFRKIFDISPKISAHDLHTDYLSSRYAMEQVGVDLIEIQHHHAHIASCMAENGVLKGPVIGVSFDGTGLGTDGTLWGGEFLLCDYKGFERLGHLQNVPMVSGENCIREPWRMAAVYMRLALGNDFMTVSIPFCQNINLPAWKLLEISLAKGINSPLTSSMGRLFDAVSALLGICGLANYEGQAAIELEQAADPASEGSYKYEILINEKQSIINTMPIIRDIVDDIKAGKGISVIAGKFHNTVAEFSLDVCKVIRERKSINKVALSGGVFQNTLLLEKIIKRMKNEGFVVYTHSKVPPNDGGISLGQAVIANERSKISCA